MKKVVGVWVALFASFHSAFVLIDSSFISRGNALPELLTTYRKSGLISGMHIIPARNAGENKHAILKDQ